MLLCSTLSKPLTASAPNALPVSGDYNWVGGDGSSTMLTFNNQGAGTYTVNQDTTETDQTRSVLQESVTPSQRTRRLQIFGRSNPYTIESRTGGMTSLVTDGNSILSLNNIQQFDIQPGQGISYGGGQISRPDGTNLANGVNSLYYFDGFRFYPFDSQNNPLTNPLSGPGTLYYNPTDGTAVYSIDGNLNTIINRQISDPEGTDEPTSGTVSTDAPTLPPTTLPPDSSTSAPDTPSPTPEETEEPSTEEPEETEEPTTEEQTKTRKSKSKSRGSTKSKSRKGTKRGKTPKKSKENEGQEDENECTKKTCRDRQESSRSRSSRRQSHEESNNSSHSHSRSRSRG